MELNLVNGYKTAYRMACEELKNRDFNEISLNTNAVYDKNSNTFNLKYINKVYTIDCLTGHVTTENREEEVTATVRVLLLHYLLHARVRPLTGNLISFKDLKKGAAIYYPTFYKRAVTPLVKTFGSNPDGFFKAAGKLEGINEKFGHASATLHVLPLVPITYVLWEGNEEVPPSGTILFDDTVESFLPAEDIVCGASFAVYELMRLSRE